MADKVTKQAILDIVVDNGKAIESITDYQEQINACKESVAALKAEQKEYDKQVEEGTMTEEEATAAKRKASEEINRQQQTMKALGKQMNDVSYQLQKNVQQMAENEGSLKSLRGQLSQLNAQFDSLSREDRIGEMGNNLQQQIQKVSTEIMEAEEATNRFQRNVGNYQAQWKSLGEGTDAFGKGLKFATGGIEGVKGGFEALAKNPAIAIFGIILSVVSPLVEKMKENEALMNAIKNVMQKLQPVFDLFGKAVEAVAGWISKAVEWMGDFFEANKSTFANLVAGAVGAGKALMEFLMVPIRNTITLFKGLGQIIKDIFTGDFKAVKQHATEAFDGIKDAFTKGFSFKQNFEAGKEVGQQLVAAMGDKAVKKKAKESGEAVGKEAGEAAGEAYVNTYAEKVKQQLAIAEQEIAERLKAATKGSTEELALKMEQLQRAHDAEIEALSQQEGTDTLIELKKANHLAEMTRMQEEFDAAQEAALMEETDAIIAEMTARAEAQKEIDDMVTEEAKRSAEEQRAARIGAAMAIGDALSQIGSIAEQFADQDRSMAMASKVLALAKIAISSGVAIAQGIAASQDVPFPGNLVAIATTIGTIAANITSAISTVKGAKFARGGLVVGEGTGTSDSIAARLSNVESVMTAKATSMFAPLLSSLNQLAGGAAIPTPPGADTSVLETAIARGMQAARVSVSVTEIRDIEQQMSAIDSIANV